MFEIQVSATFAAAHALRDYDGPCARNHGHNYRVEAVLSGTDLDARRMIIDFVDFERILGGVLERVDHRNLNTIPPFDTVNPTAEAIAAWLYGELEAPLREATDGRAGLARIKLWETPDLCVTYSAPDRAGDRRSS